MASLEEASTVVGILGGSIGTLLAVRTARRQGRIEKRQEQLEARLTLQVDHVPDTAPEMPRSIVGYQPIAEPWNESMRVFSHEAHVLPDFDVTMNGCAQRMWTMRWRSLGEEVRVLKGPSDTRLFPEACEEVAVGHAGLVVGNGCEQPVFTLGPSVPSNRLTDVAIEVQHWSAAP